MMNQRVDEWGRIVLDDAGMLEMFYKGTDHSQELLVDGSPTIDAYNGWCATFDCPEKAITVATPLDIDPKKYHDVCQADWLMPSEYLDLDVDQWLLARCTSDVQTSRVEAELRIFHEHQMGDVLRLFIYITETLRSNGVWWGVGRGSSVASYCLFLIGVHKIDSIAYGLNFNEFIRDN